jgi:predicted anti-sigma-YlaC factor YlaD
MNCETALPLLYDLVDGDIGREDAVSVALHLGSCPACTGKLAELKTAEEFYAAKTPVPPPPDLSRRIAAAVSGRRIRPSSDKGALGFAAAAAAACAAAAFAIESGVLGSLEAAGSRVGVATAQLLGALRLEGWSTSLAAAWSTVTTWLAAPAVLGGSVALLAGLIALQIGGSAVLLRARRRGGSR